MATLHGLAVGGGISNRQRQEQDGEPEQEQTTKEQGSKWDAVDEANQDKLEVARFLSLCSARPHNKILDDRLLLRRPQRAYHDT